MIKKDKKIFIVLTVALSLLLAAPSTALSKPKPHKHQTTKKVSKEKPDPEAESDGYPSKAQDWFDIWPPLPPLQTFPPYDLPELPGKKPADNILPPGAGPLPEFPPVPQDPPKDPDKIPPPSTREGREEKNGPQNPPKEPEKEKDKGGKNPNDPNNWKDPTKGETTRSTPLGREGGGGNIPEGGNVPPNIANVGKSKISHYGGGEKGDVNKNNTTGKSLTSMEAAKKGANDGFASAASSYYKNGTRGVLSDGTKFIVEDSNISNGRPVNGRINDANELDLRTSSSATANRTDTLDMTITKFTGVRPEASKTPANQLKKK